MTKGIGPRITADKFKLKMRLENAAAVILREQLHLEYNFMASVPIAILALTRGDLAKA
jgi:hypothetical protein